MADKQPCPDVSQLVRLLEGLLTEQDQEELNAHLEQCAACQERLDELIAGQGFWSDVARHLKSAHSEIEAGTATRYAARPGETFDQADDDLTLEFLEHSDKPDSLGRLEHYEVLEVIGRGGMGIVLRAFDEKLHRVVAIKVMAPRLAATSPPRKRFLREARAAAQVRHEHVVDIHAVEEQPIPHLVMEYVPGESLQQRLNRIGPLEVPDVLRIGQQIARGLAAAHAQGLIHRDVKPGNILLEKGIEERVKITDFGLARAADDASVTQSGVIAGTPLYMAPEQAQGGAIDHRVDLFSLGSVLYTMCSGRPPFRASTSLAVLKRVVEDAPRPIQEIIPEVPQWLCDIIAKLHAKRPEDRFQSAKEVADLLGRCQQEYEQHGQVAPLPQAAPPPPAPPKPHLTAPAIQPRAFGIRSWIIAASALLLLLCVLSLSEATGVTQVAATVIRLLTPEGTLVVETNDPGVKVTIEGDGGLVVTGAGPQEVRLRPGSYQLRADKNGQRVPLNQELVTITRGNKEVVRVRREAPAAAAVPTAERGAFLLLGGNGAAEQKFDTLFEAVLAASNGDTIEVRGNGPFVTKPISVQGRALTIRAAEPFRPVIQCGAGPFLRTDAPLILEGLEFQRLDREPPKDQDNLVTTAPLYVANCRFRVDVKHVQCLTAFLSPQIILRNCEFLSPSFSTIDWTTRGRQCDMDNCLVVGCDGLCISGTGEPHDCSALLRRNTIVSGAPLVAWLSSDKTRTPAAPNLKPISVEGSGNIFDGAGSVLLVIEPVPFRGNRDFLQPKELLALLPQLLAWRDRGNLYAPRNVSFVRHDFDVSRLPGPNSLADWKRFWGAADRDVSEGVVRYRGGNLRAKMAASPDKLTRMTSVCARTALGTAPAKTARTSGPTWTWSAPARPTNAGRRRPSTSSGSRRQNKSVVSRQLSVGVPSFATDY